MPQNAPGAETGGSALRRMANGRLITTRDVYSMISPQIVYNENWRNPSGNRQETMALRTNRLRRNIDEVA